MPISKLFVVKGMHDCGKTAVLKRVIEKLLKRYDTFFVDNGGKRISADEITIHDDLIGTITVNGKAIAVNTAGDTGKHTEETVALFEKNIDIGLCAVRSKSVTCRKMNEFARDNDLKDGVDYFVISKMYFGNFDATINADIIQKVNELQVQWLFDEVCKYLS